MIEDEKKTFDCVEMQHHGAEKLREKLSGMTREAQLAYWQNRTQELRERQDRLKKARGMGDAICRDWLA